MNSSLPTPKMFQPPNFYRESIAQTIINSLLGVVLTQIGYIFDYRHGLHFAALLLMCTVDVINSL